MARAAICALAQGGSLLRMYVYVWRVAMAQARILSLCAALLVARQAFAESGELDQLEQPLEPERANLRVQQITSIPVCGVDEFLTSNGTHLVCRMLPDVGFCDCPTPDVPTDGPTAVIPPQPPLGCEVFLPPTRGAFICLKNDSINIIYCSVLCDHRFEFSSTPFNPYRCGTETNFNWRDFSGFIHTALPDCTGFRHRLRTLHSLDFYLPSPCYGLSSNTIRVLMMDLQIVLEEKGCSKEDCPLESMFLQCPGVSSSVTFFSDIPTNHVVGKK